MELGGNAPFLVFDDADVDDAVEGGLLAKMRNIGEACTSANRFHVAASVAEEFAEKLAAGMGDLKIGRGTEEDVKVGPLIDEDRRARRSPSWWMTPGRVRRCSVAGSASTAPATSTRRRCCPRSRPTRDCSRRRSSARWRP